MFLRFSLFTVVTLLNIVICKDLYIGMFRKNDFLVAQDTLYKERIPFRSVVAKYGRIFKCMITYLRVVDRLGIGGGPSIRIVRGGIRKKFVVFRITSVYNNPVSVNVYVGCENKKTTPKPVKTTAKPKATQKPKGPSTEAGKATTIANDTKESSEAEKEGAEGVITDKIETEEETATNGVTETAEGETNGNSSETEEATEEATDNTTTEITTKAA